ncbi:MAG: hypothetical protein EXR86_14610 [Gammaproteobacteria bacterium]|nr:hypothetical protein [Gammaproteobacteria bacterium]
MNTWQQMTAANARHLSPDSERAALSQLSQLAGREADIMTSNQTFQLLGMIFFSALLLMPLVKKVPMSAGSAGH